MGNNEENTPRTSSSIAGEYSTEVTPTPAPDRALDPPSRYSLRHKDVDVDVGSVSPVAVATVAADAHEKMIPLFQYGTNKKLEAVPSACVSIPPPLDLPVGPSPPSPSSSSTSSSNNSKKDNNEQNTKTDAKFLLTKKKKFSHNVPESLPFLGSANPASRIILEQEDRARNRSNSLMEKATTKIVGSKQKPLQEVNTQVWQIEEVMNFFRGVYVYGAFLDWNKNCNAFGALFF